MDPYHILIRFVFVRQLAAANQSDPAEQVALHDLLQQLLPRLPGRPQDEAGPVEILILLPQGLDVGGHPVITEQTVSPSLCSIISRSRRGPTSPRRPHPLVLEKANG